jgi:FkbM family methyltransferase
MRIVGALKARAEATRKLVGLGVSRRDKAKIAALVLLMPVLRRSGRDLHITVVLELGGQTVPWVVANDSDLMAVYEVFRLGEYDAPDVPTPEVIVDLGSHIGASVLFFHQRYPAARIIAAEPDPTNFEKLRRNVAHLTGVDLFNVAVGESNGTIDFYASGELDGWASSTQRTNRWQRKTTVDCVTLDRLHEMVGVGPADLVKIDVEGAEYAVLSNFTGLAEVGAVLGEVHPTLMDRSVADFRGLLDGFSVDVTAHRAFRAVRPSQSR